jgi:outer membrane lipoprotein-sorting protein
VAGANSAGDSVNKLILILTVVIGGQACVLADPAGDGLPGFFRAWLAAQQNAPDLRVEFSITKTLPTLKAPVQAPGRFWSYADGRFRWESGKPATSVLVFDGVTLQSWDAGQNHWRKLNPNHRDMRLWMDFLGAQKLTEAGMLKDFRITAPAATKPLAMVMLEPKSPQTRRNLPKIELTFNTVEARLVQMRVQQGDGGSQTMDFREPTGMTAADRAVVTPPSQ